MILPNSFGLHLEGAVKEVTWWTWIRQSLVNVFWVVMALNNLFVGFIFLFRVSTLYFRYFIKCRGAKHSQSPVCASWTFALVNQTQALIASYVQDTN